MLKFVKNKYNKSTLQILKRLLMSANKIKMSVSNKIQSFFFKFLKHAKAILQNPLPFHAKNFDTLGDIFV
jgi:hypothetical protein